jgi:hypothetical protein
MAGSSPKFLLAELAAASTVWNQMAFLYAGQAFFFFFWIKFIVLKGQSLCYTSGSEGR